jgi:hypothetical protein
LSFLSYKLSKFLFFIKLSSLQYSVTVTENKLIHWLIPEIILFECANGNSEKNAGLGYGAIRAPAVNP